MGTEKSPRPSENYNGIKLTRRRAHSEDEPLEGPSRAPPPSVCTRLGLPRVYWSHKRSPHRGASLAVKVLRISALAESILSVSPQTGDHIASTHSILSESESLPHTSLICVRIRGLLGLHRRTPRVDIRNTLQLPVNL